MKRYSVYSGDNGCIGSGLSYQEARRLYKKECNRQQFEFEDDIGYQSMAEPYQYAVSLVQEMALSQPEETDRPEDKPEFDDDGHRIQYYSWSSQEAPEAEK
ncbi:hypothetical protein BVJ53_14170 [Lacticaseibacillus chiayiensis]|uniref:Uncharacterized protein n=1 Tax=Lacticaseibacillus chiayiensis TaxID=2100821 RepID=A0A4Q1TI41_9LACO|nr:hypothetical protein [Lacticaseibacillus chiayiensis]RXT17763.1 hypothetical protein BVJ53_14170 [Lacticaseibacillus chiayiensis]